MKLFLMMLVPVIFLIGCSQSPSSSPLVDEVKKANLYGPVNLYTKTWDREFQRQAKRYIPIYAGIFGWEVLKAQCYQESLLNPAAKSPAGARGLCQFMLPTWGDCEKKFGIPLSIWSPKAQIMCSAWYMGTQSKYFNKKGVSDLADNHCYAAAGYNAGGGNINKAHKLLAKADCFKMLGALSRVTGKNARETNIYVRRIIKWCKQLGACVTLTQLPEVSS